MNYRLLRRRSPASAPRMTVRKHVPWPTRLAGLAVIVACAVAGGAWLGARGVFSTGVDQRRAELARLAAENQDLRAERERLREAAAGSADSNAVMERSTVRELGDQIAKLEADNARLKEDVAFFEAATADRQPALSASGGVAIRRFQVVQDPTTHTARYRLLLTQDSRASKDFSGDLQLTLTVQRGGKAVNIVFPRAAGAPDTDADGFSVDGGPAAYAIAFRSYKRVDGAFRFPQDAVLKAVLIKVLERGVVRSQQTVVVG